ncbi:MAG TPA: SpoIIE family protein phosphatase [Spirochaetia bacterium]|nr:SpoIIE family protein phosphatase [Spirochaetia bacterium]
MKPDLARLIEGNQLVRGLTASDVRRMAGLFRAERFAVGETISQVGSADRLFLVSEGRVQLSDPITGGVALAQVEAGGFFGERSLFPDQPARRQVARAVTEVRGLSADGVELGALLRRFPRLAGGILANVSLSLARRNDQLAEDLRLDRLDVERKAEERALEYENSHRRIRRELALAQSIQRNLLPERRKSYPGVTVAAEYLPCDELGGDITGVYQIDERRLGIYGGDICGHGVYAAMVMSYVKKLIETSFKRMFINRQYVVKPPGAILTSINESFMQEISQSDPEIYFTLFLGVLDTRQLTFEYSSAGIHVPPLVISRGSAQRLFDLSDFPIGHVRGHEYQTSHTTFASGDGFLFVSDGVIEAVRGVESFGMERLMTEAQRIIGEAGVLDLDRLMASVREFLGGEPPLDDMCLLTLSFDPSEDPAR